MRQLNFLSFILLLPTVLYADGYLEKNTDYSKAQTVKYVDDYVNTLSATANEVSCILERAGLGLKQNSNRTWRALIPEADCLGSSFGGMITIIANSRRASNFSPQETILWIDFETNKTKHVLTLNFYKSPEEVEPYGLFEIKSYQVANENSVPTNSSDITKIGVSAISGNAVFSIARNKRSNGYFEQALVGYLNGGSDHFKFVAKNSSVQLIGTASPDYLYSSKSDGSDKTCKARKVKFENVWNRRFYDVQTGAEVKVENGTVYTQFIDDNGDDIQFGRGFVNSGDYYFQNRIRGDALNRKFSARDRTTDEKIELIWNPGNLNLVQRIPKKFVIGVALGDKPKGDFQLTYDGIGLAYTDQTLTEETCDCDITEANGVKYLSIDARDEKFWHSPYGGNMSVSRKSGSGNDYEVDPTFYINVMMPMEVTDTFLEGKEVQPFICVDDSDCPHIIDGTTTVFDNSDMSVFYNANNKIEVSKSTRKKLYRPHSIGRDSPTAKHHYIVTPLDVSNFPEGTFPATLYYDANANHKLDINEKPIMTHLYRKRRHIDEQGNTYVEDRWINGATGEDVTQLVANTHDYSRMDLSINLVTPEAYSNGCDGVDASGNADSSFIMCKDLYHYDTGPDDSDDRFFITKDKVFINQGVPYIVKFYPSSENDLNDGFNERIEKLGLEKLSSTFELGSLSRVRNDIEKEWCHTDCTSILDPEIHYGKEWLFKYFGGSIGNRPGSYVKFPGSHRNLDWLPVFNTKSGQIFSDAFDESRQYVLKNLNLSQRLPAVPNSVCDNSEVDIRFTDINSPAFTGFQLSDLPSIEFDNELQDMPTWSSIPTSDANNNPCFVFNGELKGTCPENN